ncbi:MAG: hypothetical protein WKG06_10850 [Segetibacter sp.]
MSTNTNDIAVACKLTNPELQKRKAEVIDILKSKVVTRKELSNGFEYTFDGSDMMIDNVVRFIKSERICCNFFTFRLAIENNENNITLSITGPDGAKNFITSEMSF